MTIEHFLTLEGLPAATLDALLRRAVELKRRYLAGESLRDILRGKTVCNLFFENSTRTRSSFTIAAQRLGADVLDFNLDTSSSKKGESDLDTLWTIEAMGVQGFVIRHSQDFAVDELAAQVNPGTHLLNAGDGRRAHPTQGLLDMLTLREAKGEDFSRLRVLIVGDIKHSRVARSDLHALRILGCNDLRACAPASLLPDDGTLDGVRVIEDFDAALDGVDVVMMLRLQRERMTQGFVSSLEDYFRDYGLDQRRLALAKPDAVVMHPGPMNRGVEISDAVADGPRSLIRQQVANGVFARMAVLEALLG